MVFCRALFFSALAHFIIIKVYLIFNAFSLYGMGHLFYRCIGLYGAIAKAIPVNEVVGGLPLWDM